jgi:hypothetical protein
MLSPPITTASAAAPRVQATQVIHRGNGQRHRNRRSRQCVVDEQDAGDADGGRQHMPTKHRPGLRQGAVRRGEQEYCGGAHGGDDQGGSLPTQHAVADDQYPEDAEKGADGGEQFLDMAGWMWVLAGPAAPHFYDIHSAHLSLIG